MEQLSCEHMLDIIIQTLNRLDVRLTGHGERVAFGMLHLLEQDPRFPYEEVCKITLTSLLHDIGSFQHTTNIEDLLWLEQADGFSHARYGYAFLKHFSPFPGYAPIVRFHHSTRQQIQDSMLDVRLQWVAGCLQVLDSVDLYRINHPRSTASALQDFLKQLSPARYDPMAVEAVSQLLERPDYFQPLLQGQYHDALLHHLCQMVLTPREQEALLQTLVSSIDFRSHYTALHCAIMVHASDLLASLCGLDASACQSLHIGAMLHDLGKISIPTSILESSGKLHGKDWDIMRSHVTVTEEILTGRVSDEVLQIAIRHHETLDGKGYPRGLTAEQLTLPQRIVAVADIVSALSEERSYKAAFPLNEVLRILDDLCCQGKLCPFVVGILKRERWLVYDAIRRASAEASARYEQIYAEYFAL